MRIRFTRQAGGWQQVEVLRDEAVPLAFRFPPKGPVPHDAVHLFVEQEMGFANAFWGRLARGQHPDAVQAEAKAGGHASAKRAEVPDPGLVEILQAERLVECFEAELWSGGNDDLSLLAMAQAGWQASHVAPPAVADGALDRVRQRLRAFAAEWTALDEGQTIELEWTWETA